MRNYWVVVDIDGRETKLKGGPRSKDGGMDITLYIRDGGESVEAYSLLCRPKGDQLVVMVNDAGGDEVDRYEVTR